MNDHKKFELNDDELDLVSGGAQQETVQLAPGSRYYRCRNCGAQVATKQSCPVCKRYSWAVVDCPNGASITLYV